MDSKTFRDEVSDQINTIGWGNENEAHHIMGGVVRDILSTYLGSITDGYLSEKKLSLLKHQIHILSNDMDLLLTPNNLFMIWKDIDRILDVWEEAAIAEELYEGVVNLKKLRDIV